MSKAKRIVLFTIGNIDHPSSRIRGIQYIPYLEKEGYRVKWIPRIPPRPKTKFAKLISFPLGKRWLGVKRLLSILFCKPDFFFIQKIFISPLLLKILVKRNIPYFFDFDDAIYLDKKNPKSKTLLLYSIQQATHVIVSNSVLKEFCKTHGVDALIITTPIDVQRFVPQDKKKNDKPMIIGWIGSYWTTKYLDIISKPLQEIAKKHKIILRLVGADKNYSIEGVETEHLQWDYSKEPEYLQSFDIGIMPLTADEYSEAKGGYKLLMYMAAGIPSIASPVGINREIIIDDKTGFLAENKENWIASIQFFLDKPEKRIIFGKESRRIAEKQYSREVCFDRMKNILQ